MVEDRRGTAGGANPREISAAYATGSATRRELMMRIAVLPDDGIDKLHPIIKAFSA